MRFVSHWPLGVPLLFLAYLPGGTRPGRGSRRPSVFTDTRGLGMRSVTFMGRRLTAGACSFSSLRGRVSGVWNRPYKESSLVRRVNSYTGHGSSTDVTATPGASGGLPTPAVCAKRWRERMEALERQAAKAWPL